MARRGPARDHRVYRRAGARVRKSPGGSAAPAQPRAADFRSAAAGQGGALLLEHRCIGAHSEARPRRGPGAALMKRDFDIVVVGAGAIGTVAAALLIDCHVTGAGRIAVVADRLPAPGPPGADWDLRVFALSRASERLLRLCGVWERLPADRICAYERMCVWDESGSARGSGSLSFDCAELG